MFGRATIRLGIGPHSSFCYISINLMVTMLVMRNFHSQLFLWPPYGIGQAIIFLPCGFFLSSFLFFYSSPNLSGRRLHVYHTSTHGVALVRI